MEANDGNLGELSILYQQANQTMQQTTSSLKSNKETSSILKCNHQSKHTILTNSRIKCYPYLNPSVNLNPHPTLESIPTGYTPAKPTHLEFGSRQSQHHPASFIIDNPRQRPSKCRCSAPRSSIWAVSSTSAPCAITPSARSLRPMRQSGTQNSFRARYADELDTRTADWMEDKNGGRIVADVGLIDKPSAT